MLSNRGVLKRVNSLFIHPVEDRRILQPRFARAIPPRSARDRWGRMILHSIIDHLGACAPESRPAVISARLNGTWKIAANPI